MNCKGLVNFKIVFLLIVICSCLSGCYQFAPDEPEKQFPLIRFLDPTQHIAQWRWDKQKHIANVTEDSSVSQYTKAVINIGDVWRKSIVLNETQIFDEEFDIQSSGFFEF
ncbi:hypothetical protein K8T06_14050 [bacterium]|nr:hypothetical protein [bacterium]